MASAEGTRRLARDFTTGLRRYDRVPGRRKSHDDPDLGRLKAAFDPLFDAVRDDVQSVFNSTDGTNPFTAERSADRHPAMQLPGRCPPERIPRVWSVASSRWQRFASEMSVKNGKPVSPRGTTDVT